MLVGLSPCCLGPVATHLLKGKKRKRKKITLNGVIEMNLFLAIDYQSCNYLLGFNIFVGLPLVFWCTCSSWLLEWLQSISLNDTLMSSFLPLFGYLHIFLIWPLIQHSTFIYFCHIDMLFLQTYHTASFTKIHILFLLDLSSMPHHALDELYLIALVQFKEMSLFILSSLWIILS